MPYVVHMPKHEQTPASEHVTAADAALILDCDRSTVHRLIARGALTPTLKLPGLRGAVLFARADVESLAEERAA